jgi:hypothetical protein
MGGEMWKGTPYFWGFSYSISISIISNTNVFMGFMELLLLHSPCK